MSLARQQLRNYPSCVKFDGSTAFIRSGAYTGITSASAFTVAAVVSPSSYSGTQCVVSLNGNPKVHFNSGDIEFFIQAYQIYLKGVGPIGQWYEIVCSYSGGSNGTWSIYSNGNMLATGQITGSSSGSNGKLLIGTSNGVSAFFQGYMNDVCLWDVCLTSAQVKQKYQTGIPPYLGTAHLVRRYLLTEGSGTTPADSSLNADTSTSVGLTWSGNTWMKPRMPSKARQKVTTARTPLSTPRSR